MTHKVPERLIEMPTNKLCVSYKCLISIHRGSPLIYISQHLNLFRHCIVFRHAYNFLAPNQKEAIFGRVCLLIDTFRNQLTSVAFHISLTPCSSWGEENGRPERFCGLRTTPHRLAFIESMTDQGEGGNSFRLCVTNCVMYISCRREMSLRHTRSDIHSI